MPGKLYMNDIRLSRAFSEGFSAGELDSNPHPVNAPAWVAWNKGYAQDCPGEDGYYGGVAEHTGNWWCAFGPGAVSEPPPPPPPEPPPEAPPDASWTKEQIVAWLVLHLLSPAANATKDELLAMVQDVLDTP